MPARGSSHWPLNPSPIFLMAIAFEGMKPCSLVLNRVLSFPVTVVYSAISGGQNRL